MLEELFGSDESCSVGIDVRLKQGIGRLIRTATDRGIVVLFDPRVLTKPYGRVFLEALPEAKRVVDGVEEAKRRPRDPLAFCGERGASAP